MDKKEGANFADNVFPFHSYKFIALNQIEFHKQG